MAPKFKNWYIGSIRLCLLWHHVSSAFFRLYSGLPTGIISNWLRSKFLRRKCIAMFHPDYSSSICRGWTTTFLLHLRNSFLLLSIAQKWPHTKRWTRKVEQKNHLNWFQKSLLMIPTFSTKCIWMGNPAKYISQREMFLLITFVSSRSSDSWPLKPCTFWTFGMRRAI